MPKTELAKLRRSQRRVCTNLAKLEPMVAGYHAKLAAMDLSGLAPDGPFGQLGCRWYGAAAEAGKSQERRMAPPGSLCVLPGGVDFSVQQEEESHETIHVYLRDAVLREVAAELLDGDPARVELVPNFGDQDPMVEQLALEIRDTLTARDPGARVYAGQLARTLGAQLLRAHSNRVPQPAVPPRGGLTHIQLARAIEFMDSNLGRPLRLGEIAGAVGRSPPDFMRQFKVSTGSAPRLRLVGQRA